MKENQSLPLVNKWFEELACATAHRHVSSLPTLVIVSGERTVRKMETRSSTVAHIGKGRKALFKANIKRTDGREKPRDPFMKDKGPCG